MTDFRPLCTAAPLLFVGLGLWACATTDAGTAPKPPAPLPSPAPAPSPEPAGPDRDTLAERAWSQRARRDQLEQAIAHWEDLLADAPQRGDILTRLTRAYFFLGDGHLHDAEQPDEQLAAFERGIQVGERAMMASSVEFAERVRAGERVEDAVAAIPKEGQAAVYWYASNLGRFSVAKGFTTTLFYKDRIHALMTHVLDLDENFFHAAAHRYFGAFYAQAPAFAGGDLAASKRHFERALELDASFLGTKVLYAEYYAVKAGDRQLFVRLLGEVVAADPGTLPDLLAEQEVEQAKARQLIAQTDLYF